MLAFTYGHPQVSDWVYADAAACSRTYRTSPATSSGTSRPMAPLEYTLTTTLPAGSSTNPVEQHHAELAGERFRHRHGLAARDGERQFGERFAGMEQANGAFHEFLVLRWMVIADKDLVTG